MRTSTFNITLSNRVSTFEAGTLVFEQEPWSKNLGYLTKVGTVMMIGRILEGTVDPAPFCGDEGEGFSKKIYAYPNPVDLNYTIGVSSGDIGGRLIDIYEFSEELRINYDTTATLRFCVTRMISYEWVGDVYDKGGRVTNKPLVAVERELVALSKAVYGILKVTYDVTRHVYEARIRPDISAVENSLKSFVYAVWGGGNGYLEVAPPEGAEEEVCNNRRTYGSIPTDLIGGNAGLTTGSTVITGPSGIPECVRPEDVTEEEDYCTGLPIS